MKSQLIIYTLILFLFGCKKEDGDNTRKAQIPDQTEINKLKINQLQILGSHNSYHKHMDTTLFNGILGINFLLPNQYKVTELDYYHEPLLNQLNDFKLRGFEIDIYADPQGGHFYNRAGNALVGIPVASGIAELQQPGFKVLHIPDIDFETYFYTFKSNLLALKNWSDAHPNHLPIFIHIEAKENGVGDAVPFLATYGFTQTIKFTPTLADDIDKEIKSVFGNTLDKIITPDIVRGTYTTLKEAVLANNWPTVGDCRGKFIFVMEGGANDEYLDGHPSLQGRAMFLYTKDDASDESAFLIYNDADSDEVKITSAVNNYYIVRTRADGTNNQNVSGDYTQQEAAFRSGAQIISTDYYRPDPRYITKPGQYTNYSCQFPNGDFARINPVSAADKQGIGKIAE